MSSSQSQCFASNECVCFLGLKGLLHFLPPVPSEEYVKNEKERFVPWSLTPFREPLAKTHGGSSEGEEEGETAPEWLELVRDGSLARVPFY